MPLIYSSVSRGTVTLAEHAAFIGNFSSVAKDFLEKAGKNDGKFTYSVDGHTFNFLTRNGLSKWLQHSKVHTQATVPGPSTGDCAAEPLPWCPLQRTLSSRMKRTGAPSRQRSWTRWQLSLRPSTRTKQRRPRSLV